MAFTYAGDPANSNLEEVRFLIGDTVEGERTSLNDAEITYQLAQDSNDIMLTAYHCALNRQSKVANYISGGASLPDSSALVRNLATTVQNLMARLPPTGASFGGVSESDQRGFENDTDLIQSEIVRRQHDNDDGHRREYGGTSGAGDC